MEAIPSPLDCRDWIAEAIFPAKSELNLPKKLDLRKDLQPIRNQGSQGTCAAQTAACLKEWQEKKDVKLDEHFSPQFIYNNRSNFPNPGMYGRDVMRILHKIGCCREQYFPYEKDKNIKGTPEDTYKDASKYKIKSYAQCNTIEGVKKALYKNGPCYISFPTYNHGRSFWKPEKLGQKRIGGHAVTIVGYNTSGFIIRNSWGKNWCDQGYTLYPYDEFGSHWEIWTTIDDKSIIPDDKDKLYGSCYKFLTFLKETKVKI